MFEVKVTVDAPELASAINRLADSIGRVAGFSAMSVTPEGAHIMSTTPAVTAEEQAPAITPAPVDVPPMVEVPATPAEQPVTAPVAPVPTPAKKYTFKQISKAGAALCTDVNKMDQLVSLLNSKYGVPAITMIDEARYNELAADLIALGATIEED